MPYNSSSKKRFIAITALALGALQSACTEEPQATPEDAIVVGALLPFTGKEAALGRNLEQALLLAVKDVNDAGGIAGRQLVLKSRDSNSGSARGFEELLHLLYTDNVQYLIGPEENELANAIVPDVKALDVLNLLPGYAAPVLKRRSSTGAWVRLAPSPGAIGCGMAHSTIAEEVQTANAIVTLDDYNLSVAGEFNSHFGALGGTGLPFVTVQAGASSYVRQIRSALDRKADRTLLIAYPATASAIATDWTITGRPSPWYLSSMLRTEVFLLNKPFGALDGYSGLSPSLSLADECVTTEEVSELSAVLECTRDNADDFAAHFASHWGGDRPFAAAHFYYDAVALLALGLQRAFTKSDALPSATSLHGYIRELDGETHEHATWQSLGAMLDAIAAGEGVRYVGAAAEYTFDSYGIAEHTIFDTWKVANDGFVDTGHRMASCPRISQ